MTTTDQPLEGAVHVPDDPDGVILQNVAPVTPVSDETNAIVDDWKAGTDLVQREELLPTPSRFTQMKGMATELARSKLMPKHIKESRDPEADLFVILLLAHDLGLSATTALQKVAVIEGKPAMAAELMRLLVQRDGHRIWTTVEYDETERPVAAVCHGVRKEHPEFEDQARFTLADAVVAGLCKVNAEGDVIARSTSGKVLPWEAFTEDMLVARASSRGCRRMFPDCLAGVSYTPDEIGQIVLDAEPENTRPMVAATDEQKANVLAALEALSEHGQVEARARWKAHNLGSLKVGQMRALAQEEVPFALQLIEDVARAEPADAEIVPETPSVAAGGVDEGGAVEQTAMGVEALIPAWLASLPVRALRAVVGQSGVVVAAKATGDEMRTAYLPMMELVAAGTMVDPRACTNCGGYRDHVPPFGEPCARTGECPF